MVPKWQQYVRNGLLAFVFLSVGFLLGKHSARRGAAPEERVGPAPGPRVATSPAVVRVYYLHGTARCVSCNAIERMTRELLDGRFADELVAGRVEWRTVNFQENDALAKQFDVAASTVVVAKLQADTVTAFRRLDEVWTLKGEPAEFNAHVAEAINGYLQ